MLCSICGNCQSAIRPPFLIALAGPKHLRLPSVKPSLARLPETGGWFSWLARRQINHPGLRPKTGCPIRSCVEAAFQRWPCSLVRELVKYENQIAKYRGTTPGTGGTNE